MRDGKLWGLVGSLSLLNSIGTFQAYLDSHRLHAYSSQEMGWIFNVFTFLTFSAVLKSELSLTPGPRPLIIPESILVMALICHLDRQPLFQ